MEIIVLGTGACAKCGQLYEAAVSGVKEAGLDIEVQKVSELSKIMEYKVMSMPALVINGEVKFAGKVPSASEIAALLK